MFEAQSGDTVKVHYTGKLADGTVFDTSEGKRPLTFNIGKKEVIAGFEQACTGMVMGEEKTVTIPPCYAYGEQDAKLVEEIPLADLPDDLELRVGGQLEITGQDGNILLVMVTGLNETTVTLDGNHPLAGKELTFAIRMEEIEKKQPK